MPKEEKGAGFALSLRAISWPFPVEPYSSPRNGRGNGRERAKPKEEAPFGGVSSFRFALSLRAISWPFPVEPNSSPRNLQFQSDCFFRIFTIRHQDFPKKQYRMGQNSQDVICKTNSGGGGGTPNSKLGVDLKHPVK